MANVTKKALLDTAREKRVPEAERVRLLALFDDLVTRIPKRNAKAVAAELADVAAARGGSTRC